MSEVITYKGVDCVLDQFKTAIETKLDWMNVLGRARKRFSKDKEYMRAYPHIYEAGSRFESSFRLSDKPAYGYFYLHDPHERIDTEFKAHYKAKLSLFFVFDLIKLQELAIAGIPSEDFIYTEHLHRFIESALILFPSFEHQSTYEIPEEVYREFDITKKENLLSHPLISFRYEGELRWKIKNDGCGEPCY